MTFISNLALQPSIQALTFLRRELSRILPAPLGPKAAAMILALMNMDFRLSQLKVEQSHWICSDIENHPPAKTGKPRTRKQPIERVCFGRLANYVLRYSAQVAASHRRCRQYP